MSLHQQFKMDETKQQNGVLIQYGANADGSVPGFRLLRRNSSNQRYMKCLERETAPYRRLIELGTLDPKISERVFMRIFCSSVLIAWENVQVDGEVVPFSIDNAVKLFSELPDLYEDLQAQSVKASLFRQETIEGDAKN